MKGITVAVLAIFAAVTLGGCCSYKTKKYPYPKYDLSPAVVYGAGPCSATPVRK